MGLEMSFCESRNETKRHEPVRRVLNRFLPWNNYLFIFLALLTENTMVPREPVHNGVNRFVPLNRIFEIIIFYASPLFFLLLTE